MGLLKPPLHHGDVLSQITKHSPDIHRFDLCLKSSYRSYKGCERYKHCNRNNSYKNNRYSRTINKTTNWTIDKTINRTFKSLRSNIHLQALNEWKGLNPMLKCQFGKNPFVHHLSINIISIFQSTALKFIPSTLQLSSHSLRSYSKLSIDQLKEHTVLQFSKSSGPGGQNVNKVNTKAEGKFHIGSADFLPDDAKERLREKHSNRVNKSDELVISSQVYREQLRNAEDVLLKIRDIVKDALIVPKERKIREGRTEKGEYERRKLKDEQKMKKENRSSKWQKSVF